MLASYLFALNVLDLSVKQSRTVATTVVVLTGLYLIIVLEAANWRRGAVVGAMCAGLVALYVLALAVPFTRDFFELAVPGPEVVLMSLAGAGIAVLALYLSGFTPGHSPLLDVRR